jgi:hypothetical protein
MVQGKKQRIACIRSMGKRRKVDAVSHLSAVVFYQKICGWLPPSSPARQMLLYLRASLNMRALKT